MHSRSLLALILLAGAAADTRAQSATFTWNWNRASDPITAPAPAALLPGESARVWLDVSWDPGAVPNVRGLSTLWIDLIATDAQGTWVNSGPGFNGTQINPFENFNWADWGHRRDLLPQSASAWYMLGVANWGTYDPVTGSITSIQAGQIGINNPVSSVNPILEIWRGQFTPESYFPRTIRYTGQKAAASPTTGVTLYTRATGQAFFETIQIPHANINFGTLEIPIIPAPSTLALLSLTALLANRRRR